MALNKLIEKGFVSFVKEGKRNIYQASNPQHIIDYVDDVFTHKKNRLEKIVPVLISQQQKAPEKPTITTFQGIRGIK